MKEEYIHRAWDLEDLLGQDERLAVVRDELARQGADDAAAETEELRLAIRSLQLRATVVCRRLSGTWEAVERHWSGDLGAEALAPALTAYRSRIPGAAGVFHEDQTCSHSSRWAALELFAGRGVRRRGWPDGKVLRGLLPGRLPDAYCYDLSPEDLLAEDWLPAPPPAPV